MTTVETSTPLERAVLERMLDPALATLRLQLASVSVRQRTLTGMGFFTDLRVAGPAPRPNMKHRARLGGLAADIPGIRHGAGFVLHVRDGLLDALEGYTYDEPWPERVDTFTLTDFDRAEREREERPVLPRCSPATREIRACDSAQRNQANGSGQ